MTKAQFLSSLQIFHLRNNNGTSIFRKVSGLGIITIIIIIVYFTSCLPCFNCIFLYICTLLKSCANQKCLSAFIKYRYAISSLAIGCSIIVCVKVKSIAVVSPCMTQHVMGLVCYTAPSSGLIDALCNEVCGKSVFELAAVLERVVHLSVGHAATFEPAVKDLRDPPKLAFTTAGRDC